MEKFLLSSPTQLSQPYDESTTILFDVYEDPPTINHNLSTNHHHHLHSSTNINLSNIQQQPQTQQQDTQQSQFQQLQQLQTQSQPFDLNNNHFLQYYNHNSNHLSTPFEDEIVPISTNLPENKFYLTTDENNQSEIDPPSCSNNGNNNSNGNSLNFNHSRNISLDYQHQPHLSYGNTFNHQHSNSTVSINQDPPIHLSSIPQSMSSNTIYSIDSISSFDSPLQQPIQQQNAQQQSQYPPQQAQQTQFPQQHSQFHQMSTPRRIGRNKSLSISSYTTPLRNCPTSFSPINLATTAFSKVTKTTPARPSVKGHGHSRSRSKVSIDMAAATAAANTIASKSNSASSYNSTLNPFYTPSQFTRGHLDDDDVDDGVDGITSTPLLTPSSNIKYSQSTFFSPFHHETNDFDDQDDDAIKQLKKAKSYSNLTKNKNQDFSNSLPPPRIDLSSPEFSKSSVLVYPMDKQRTDKYQSSTSIDLTSITNESITSSTTTPSVNTAPTPQLLPPMATFSTREEEEKLNSQSKRKTKKSRSLKKNSVIESEDDNELDHEDNDNNDVDDVDDADDDETVTIPIPDDLDITRPKVRNNRSEMNKLDPKKKHKCPICESRFQRPEHVKRHLKSHSSEKPFECLELNCGKRFNRKDNLKAHLKKIHGKKPEKI